MVWRMGGDWHPFLSRRGGSQARYLFSSTNASILTMTSDRLSPPPRARERAFSIRNPSLRAGERIDHGGQLGGREVVPHAVTAGQQDIPRAQLQEIMWVVAVGRFLCPGIRPECSNADGCWPQPPSALRDLPAPERRSGHWCGGGTDHPGNGRCAIPGVHPVAVARGLMRNAAMVLCGSCSAEIAVSRMTMCASSTMALSMAAGSSVSGSSAQKAGAPSS